MLITDEGNILLTQRLTINPYGYALREVWNRFKWDMHPQSWVSRTRLKHWKDRYAGQKAVIVCNGPSLLKTDFSLLEGVFTFGLNKINLLFDKSNFRPSCIVAVNPFVIEQNKSFYNQTPIQLFLDSCATKTVSQRENVVYLHSTGRCKFARNCSISIYQGYTVTFVALQLAFHLGFKEIALIGCDHNFATKGQPNLTVTSGEKDDNHFDPNYFSGGVKWQLPDLLQSEVSYTLARDVYSSSGRKIVNASVDGNLEIFERCRLEDFVK